MKNRSTNFKRAMCWKYALKRQDRNPNYFDNLHQYSKNRKDKYAPQEKLTIQQATLLAEINESMKRLITL